MHEGAFPGTGWTHDGNELSCLDFEVDTIQCRDGDLAHTVDFAQINGLNDRLICHCLVSVRPVLTRSPGFNPVLTSAFTRSFMPISTNCTASFPLFCMTKTAYLPESY